MIEKELTVPIPLKQIEALLRRSQKEYYKRPRIEEKAKILRSGYNGEKNLNYFLSLLPEKNYSIFHNIRLPFGSSYFQIDFLLISSKLLILLDSKNHSGTLNFEKRQLIQISNGSEKIYQNPLSQGYRHKFLLNNWLKSHQIPLAPIEYHVVITNPSTKVMISPGNEEAEKRVWKSDHLLIKVEEMEKTFNKEILDKRTISKAKKLILQTDTPERIDFLKMFGIDQSEILTGVQCPSCFSTPLKYKGRKGWECPFCKYISKDALYDAINDYFHLIKSSINHSEARHFLHLPNPRITTHVLSLLHLPFTGITKGRVYYQKTTNHFSPRYSKY